LIFPETPDMIGEKRCQRLFRFFAGRIGFSGGGGFFPLPAARLRSAADWENGPAGFGSAGRGKAERI